MGEGSSPSSRSPKRPRSPSSAPDDAKRLKLSPRDDVRDKTLRIVAQSLRDENRQLVQDKETLSEQLLKTQRSLKDVEDDLARVYRQKEKKLQEKIDQKLLETSHTPLEVEQTKDISFIVRQSTEMDKFLQSCELWQAKLKFLSTKQQEKKKKVENQELQSVVSGLVTTVEVKTLENEMEKQQQLLHWTLLLQEETVDCLKKSSSCRQETELFEAMEKQLMDDRVVEIGDAVGSEESCGKGEGDEAVIAPRRPGEALPWSAQ